MTDSSDEHGPHGPLDPVGKAMLAEVLLGNAQGGRKQAAPLTVDVLRSLGPADVLELAERPLTQAPVATIKTLRHSHHHLARLIADGMPQGDIGAILGYSQSHISVLKAVPAFAELIEYYKTQREMKFADVWDRMRILGLNTIEELQDRLDSDPESWSNRELMELSRLMLVEGSRAVGPGAAAAGGTGPATAVNIEVKFVAAGGEASRPGPIIDMVGEKP